MELYSTYIMTESIKAQIDSFVMGFYSVIPKSSIRYFKADELELLMCGLPQIDHQDWKLNTEYNSCQVTKEPVFLKLYKALENCWRMWIQKLG